MTGLVNHFLLRWTEINYALLGVYPWPFTNTNPHQGSQFYCTVDTRHLIIFSFKEDQGLYEGCPFVPSWHEAYPAVLLGSLYSDAACHRVTRSRVVRMQTRVCALSFPVLLSSHNQWPSPLRWWMREKCSVSKHVVPTVQHSLSLSLSLPALPLSFMFLSFLLCFLSSHPHTCWAPEGQQPTLLSACAANHTLDECRHMHVCFPVQSCDSSSLPLHDSPLPSHIVPADRLFVVDVECCLWCVCRCVPSLQARVKNEILDYKDLAALPKVKAIYEVQQPDLITSSCQPFNRYTSDDRLDTYIYGEVFLLHTLSFDDIIILVLHSSHFTGASAFVGLFLTNVCWIEWRSIFLKEQTTIQFSGHEKLRFFFFAHLQRHIH